ncbi:MAG: ABC transporter substrate-binding protein [Ndongobacter sp.]|nr:ABC transporter substrate-binding protein [Ndongobacter sp.]
MKKLSALLLAALLALSACGGGAQQSASTSEPAKESEATSSGAAASGDVIKIGYVGALSGETALWGQAGLNGMKMAADDINAAGGLLGKQVEIVGYDGKGDPMDSVNALNKLVTDDVVAVVGTNFSSCNIPMAEIADANKLPLIATAASSPLVTVGEDGKLHPYSFRIGFTDPYQGKVLAAYAVNKLEAKKGAILTNIADSYSTGIKQYLVEEYTKLGGEIVADESASSGDQDFRSQLSKIKEANPDVLFLPWIYKDVALITGQARELGIECVFLGADGWDSQDLPELAKGSVEGSYFCSRTGFNTPEAKEFKDRYEKEYKITAEAECLFGYDGVMWIKQVIEQKNSAERDAIREGLEGTAEFKGLLGTMAVDPATHDPARDAAIFKISGATIEFIEVYNPAN